MDSEVKSFLSNRRNLALAWDISEAMEEMSEHVYLSFWKSVRQTLDDYLLEKEYSDTWKVSFDDEGCGFLFIEPTALASGGSAFGVGAESLNGEPYGACYYGIRRGKKVAKVAWCEEDNAVSEALTQYGFKSSLWWVGWKFVSKLGLPKMEGEEKEELLDIHDDNCDEKHPLAEIMANAILEIFDKHRSVLEKLNDKYPY